MDSETQPVNLTKSWLSKHPLVLIGCLLVVCLVPFINKAVHTDDALYVWTGQWIQRHPFDCFGFEVNEWFSAIPMWKANWNPPLMSYFLAGVASLFGWSEIVLHSGGLVIAFAAAAGIYSLAQRWCGRPLLATVIAMFTPAFLVSSTTLMCDVLMLAFWIWALVFWECAMAGGKSRWWFLGAGIFAGLAVLTKYSAVTLLPLLPILSILKTRKLGWWWVGIAVPLIMVAGYEWMTAKMYGTGLFLNAVAHTQHSREFPSSWEARGIIGFAFAGGCLLPLQFFAPFLWRPKALLVGGAVTLGIWLAMFPLWNMLGLINGIDPKTMKQWFYLLQVALLVAGGLHLLLFTTAEAWRARDINSVILVLWIISGLFSATVLNFAINARSFLLIVPPVAILLVRRLEATRGSLIATGRMVWPLIPTAAISLSIAVADYQLANSARTAAEQIGAKYKYVGHQLWFVGHGAFQYYMQKLDGQPIDIERSLLQPGDFVAVSQAGTFISFPQDTVGWVEDLVLSPFSWMNLLGYSKDEAAGFYGANMGPVPFVIGKLPPQGYVVVKVFSRVHYSTQPTNPQAVQTGAIPSFSSVSIQADPMAFVSRPEVMNQVQLAVQLESEGRIEEAIQIYRSALNMDSTNAVVLNNLAWLLATAGQPELRNGEEAVQLATQAVVLTDYRRPSFIGTLGVAYAETGEFSKAAQTFQAARILAMLTNQSGLAATIDQLSRRYAEGKSVETAPAP